MHKNKHIWIINEVAGAPAYGMGFRHYYLAKQFVKQGYDVTIISSSYSHLFKAYPSVKKEKIDEIDYHWINTINYNNAHNNKRVLQWFIFTFKIFFLPFILKKPDVIIASPMVQFSVFPAWLIAKLYKAKLIYEVRDIWPLSLIEIGKVRKNHPFVKLIALFEKFSINKSDLIVSNLQNYNKHMEGNLNSNKSFKWVSNGIDLDEQNNKLALPNMIKEKLPKDKFIIGYTGTVGFSNSLDTFCESAKLLSKQEDICFVIVGDGQEKENLKKEYGYLNNLIFIDSIQKREVPSILELFDACYIGLKKENLFKYGVSPNKLFDYMYSSKPILYAIESGKSIVDISNCGISIEAQSPKAIVEGVKKLYAMPKEEREILGSNGKEYILEHFTYEKLAKEYIECF